MIGIIGGVGPLAGVDLLNKIIKKTEANCDQDHLNVVLFSCPKNIPDRTLFLAGETSVNPAYPISELLLKSENIGCSIAAIACNTAHAKPIFDEILYQLEKSGSKLKLMNIIEETVHYINVNYPGKVVGVLSTKGTAASQVYHLQLKKFSIPFIALSDSDVNKVHQAIYDLEYGVKSFSQPIKEKAKQDLLEVVLVLKGKGVETIILGCSELPLVFTQEILDGLRLIDPNLVLAEAIIRNSKKIDSFCI